jgi:membrane protein insertase Oxa1/YidC/SpoIIIJ
VEVDDTYGQCSNPSPAPAGKSDIGSKPFLAGVRAWIDHLGGHLAFLKPVLTHFAEVVLAPFAFFTWICGFLGILFGWLLIPVFAVADRLLGRSNSLALVLSSLVLLLAVRVAWIPVMAWAARGQVKTELMKPKIRALRENYGDDRKELDRRVIQLQAEVNFNPLSGCLSVIPLILVVSGFYALARNLTTRSDTGTFDPRHIPSTTSLFGFLHDQQFLHLFGMNLTLALPQVGACASVVPYIVAMVVLVAAQLFLIRHIGRSRGWKVQIGFAAFFTLGVVALPMFFVLLRIGDSVFFVLQRQLTKRVQEHEYERLLNDPEFRAMVGELSIDFIPEQSAKPRLLLHPADRRPHHHPPDTDSWRLHH